MYLAGVLRNGKRLSASGRVDDKSVDGTAARIRKPTGFQNAGVSLSSAINAEALWWP